MFRGDVEEYPWWRSRFRQAIESYPMSNVKKMHFLMDCLEGEPKEMLLSLVSADNVNESTLDLSLIHI